jgi:hypothetical protein
MDDGDSPRSRPSPDVVSGSDLMAAVSLGGNVPDLSSAPVPARTRTYVLDTSVLLADPRALVRFDYGSGPAVTESLRASVVSQALKSRRTKGPAAAPRNTLRVRVDLPDLDL